MMRHLVVATLSALNLGAAMTAANADTVTLYAAGSLKGALTEVAKAYEAKSGNTVATKFGPSGLLRKEIAGKDRRLCLR